jgi:hypothetical protein
VELADFVLLLARPPIPSLHQHHLFFLSSQQCLLVYSLRGWHSLQHVNGLAQERSTLLRREMAAWLAGPGYKFRRQFPGSTNYLSAYDKLGNLVRRGKGRPTDVIDAEEEARSEERALKEEEDEDLDEAERSARAEGRAAERERRAAALKRTPRERASDMRPYPLNNNFRSQPVLSEELREELYRQIVIKKMDLQSVSAAYGVDMRRVAAVVRLKTVEKQWIEDVSLTIPFPSTPVLLL